MSRSFILFALFLVLLALVNPIICGGGDDDEDSDELSPSEKAQPPPTILGASPNTLTNSDFVDGFYYSPLSSSAATISAFGAVLLLFVALQ